MVEKKRLYNLDLIRIVAMLMIVTLHFIGKGGLLSAFPPMSFKYDIVLFIESVCNIGVNCFILISGYFLVSSKFRIKKLLSLEAEVIFYTVLIYLGLVLTGKVPFMIADLFASFVPTLMGEYWFVSAYVGMYILSPFLNMMINGLDRNMHKKLIITLVCLFSIWPIVFFFGNSFGLQGYYLNTGFNVIWFVVLYFIAGYIGLYYKPDFETRTWLLRYVSIATICGLVALVASFLSNQFNSLPFKNLCYLLNGYNSITMLLPSVAMFILFLNLKIKDDMINSAIAFFAPLSFAVYLIHDEPHVRSLLWNKLQVTQHIQSPKFIFYAAVCIISIYIVCSLVDFVRIVLFNAVQRSRWFNDIYQKVRRLYLRLKGTTERFELIDKS